MYFAIEATICCFFKAYNYYPMIFPESRIDDNLAGNLFSQFLLTATALFIAVYNLKKYWFLICSIFFIMIEELFQYLGIYSHNWYRTWMTLGFMGIFWMAKKLYDSDIIYKPGMARYCLMFFGIFTMHMPMVMWGQIITGIVSPSRSLLGDPMSSYAFISLSNLIILSVVCMFIYFSKIKFHYKVLVTLALYCLIYAAKMAGLVAIKKGWFLFFSTADIFGMYLAVFVLNKLMTPKKPPLN